MLSEAKAQARSAAFATLCCGSEAHPAALSWSQAALEPQVT